MVPFQLIFDFFSKTLTWKKLILELTGFPEIHRILCNVFGRNNQIYCSSEHANLFDS